MKHLAAEREGHLSNLFVEDLLKINDFLDVFDIVRVDKTFGSQPDSNQVHHTRISNT